MSIKKVGLILNGTKDCWIAEALAEKEIDVQIFDQSGDSAAVITDHIETILDRKLAKWAITQTEKKVILSHIKHVSDLESFEKVDFLIESTCDQLEAKKDLLGTLDHICPQEMIIASNNCIFRVSELAEGISHPERVIGLHFQEDLVEITPGECTSEFTVNETSRFVESIGKAGIRVSDVHGLVSMRLILPLINEAFAILMAERETADEIDQVMKKGFGFKYGPFEIVDRLGLDYVLNAMEQMFELTDDKKFRPSPWLALQARTGHYVVKTGEGFFRYEPYGDRINPNGLKEEQA